MGFYPCLYYALEHYKIKFQYNILSIKLCIISTANYHLFYTFTDYFTDVQFGASPITTIPVQHGVEAAGVGPIISTVH